MRVNLSEWRKLVAAMPMALAGIWTADQDNYRSALILLFNVAAKAHTHVLNMYSGWPEAEIRAEAEGIRTELDTDGFGYHYRAEEDDVACLRRLAVHIRALEFVVSGDWTGDYPPDPNREWRVEVPGGQEFFLVPLPRRLWRTPQPSAKDERAFSKRCLFMHRIIPAEVDGVEVAFHPLRALSPTKGAELSFGAALFEKVNFCEAETQDPFTVTEVKLDDRETVIEEAIEKAHKRPCFSVVFPELTIDPEAVAQIRLLFKTKPFAGTGSVRSPSVVVAGSWHKPTEGSYVNAASVLDGMGRPLFEYVKRHAYGGQGRNRENITHGTDFPILLSPEGLVAFAICLDFCNHATGKETLYERVDVDFLLVTSCGNATTMKSHLHTAYMVHRRYGTVSFIAQQCHPPMDSARGYAAVWREKPDPTEETSRVVESWKECFSEISFGTVDTSLIRTDVN